MNRLLLFTMCIVYAFSNGWCALSHQIAVSRNYTDSIEDGSIFHIDDSLLNLVSPESRNRTRRVGIQNREFSHSQVLHYTPNTSETPYYLIVTTSSLYNTLETTINIYAEDVHTIYGYGIYLETVSNPNPEQLKALIVYYQNNLCGVIFIGELGEAFFEIDADYGGKYGYRNWPCDLFFMDLDGFWYDSDSNGIYDVHSGNVAPEIFFARLSAQGLSDLGDEETLIRKQLQKSHNYWWKSTYNNPDIALSYIDKDWVSEYSFLSSFLNPIYGVNNVEDIRYSSTSVFSPSDYINRLSSNIYGFTLLAAHSSPILHQFTNGYVYVSNIKNNISSCFVYNLFCCNACNWTNIYIHNYLGGSYLFNNGKTLAVIGSAKTGGMLGAQHFYSQFPSKNIGGSFLYWWNTHCGDYHSPNEISWNYGMTILGDPTIRLGHNVSDICVSNLNLTSFPVDNNSNLIIFKAGESISVSGSFIIPQGVHVVFDAPQVVFEPTFICPVGASFETRSEGCEI